MTKVHEDNKWRTVIEELQEGNNDKVSTGLMYKCGVLLYKRRLELAENSYGIPNLLEEFHASPKQGTQFNTFHV